MTKPASSAATNTDAVGVTPQAWHELIVRRCGLTFRHVRTADVIGQVHAQMRACGIDNETQYFQMLAAPSAPAGQWDALIERFTNHETSFFRHPPSFDALRGSVLPELRAARKGGRLSLWSAGCSTGQEAYSMAMCASDDAAAGEFTVWGSDISQQAIKIARHGRYGPRAVAAIPEHYRQRYLRVVSGPAGIEYDITDELRYRVRFMTTNLVESEGFRPSHDVVMCHNVLIYFSPGAVTRAVSYLASCVALGGYLMLGPGEAPSDRPAGLEPVIVNGVRAFQRRSARPLESRP
jgi:type IV pilus assembly protein PilK